MKLGTTSPAIETARLLLRPFTADDLDDYTRLIFADADVMRYLPKRDLTPRERAERTICHFHRTLVAVWVRRVGSDG